MIQRNRKGGRKVSISSIGPPANETHNDAFPLSLSPVNVERRASNLAIQYGVFDTFVKSSNNNDVSGVKH